MTHLTRLDAVGIKAISTIKKAPSTEHCLVVKCENTKRSGRDAKSAEVRCNLERELYQDLSRYYPRTLGLWERPKLLSKCKDGCIRCASDIPLTYFIFSVG